MLAAAVPSTSGNEAEQKATGSRRSSIHGPTPEAVVLIVDDDADHRQLCARMIDRQLYRCEFATMGSEALEICRELRPHCVLLDYRLPDLNGLQILAQLTNDPELAMIAVVMLTANDDPRAVIDSMKAGAVDYLRKDELQRESLDRAIRFALQRSNLRRVEHRLHEAERLAAIGQLAAGVAHEINNPAAFVLTNLTLALEQVRQLKQVFEGGQSQDSLFADLEEGIEDSLDGIRRISGITKDLSELAHPGPKEQVEVELRDLAEQVVKLLRSKATDRCKLLIAPGGTESVFGDRGRLLQAVVNLVDNAIAAITPGQPENNWVQIRAKGTPDEVRIIVEDSGEGISPAVASRVFEPFFTTKPRGQGTGLGLALTRSIARQHGGDLEFEHLARGTRFSVILPRRSPHQTAAMSAPKVLTRPSGGTLLIIDDEKAVLRSLERVLRKHYDVVTAADARSAYSAAKTQTFDIVLCDLSMPDINGVEVFHHLSRLQPELSSRMMFLSAASVSDELRRKAATTNCPILSKPIEAASLIEAVEAHKRRS